MIGKVIALLIVAITASLSTPIDNAKKCLPVKYTVSEIGKGIRMINGKPVLVNYQGTLYKDSSKKMEAEVTHQIDEQGRRESITYIRDVNKVGVTFYRKVGPYIG